MSRPERLPLMIDTSGTTITPDERELLSERRVAGVCLFGHNIVDRFQTADYVAELRSLAGPELIVAIDQEGGGVLRLRDVPMPLSAMALGAVDDAEVTERVAALIGRSLAAVGVNLDFAPIADVNSNPANPVIADRSYGADPERVSLHVAASVRGLQAAGVAATLKHFPGHGDTDVDSHLDLPSLSRDFAAVERVDLPPFVAGIAAGAAAIMTAHIVMRSLDPEMPGTLSRRVLWELLRRRLGYEGVIVTDALDMRAVADRWSPPVSAVMSLAAGADMPLTLGPLAEHREVLAAIESAVAEGRLDGAEFQASVGRVADLAAAFPGATRPDADSAWARAAEDERLLADAAHRSLLRLGELPTLRPGDEVILVAASQVRANAASRIVTRPSEPLAQALERRGVKVVWLDSLDGEVVAKTAAAVPSAAAVLFVSTTRLKLAGAEAEVARAVAALASTVRLPFAHVALWNPYSVAELRGPALVSFGSHPATVEAVAAALLGAEVRAATHAVPVPLAVRAEA